MHYLFPTIGEFCSILLEIYCLKPPDLNIMDAITIMDGNGPAAGRVRSGGRLIASYNAPALDWVMALMANIKPEKVELVKQTLQKGLFKKEELSIEGDFYVIRDFKLPPFHILQMYQLSVVQRVLNRPGRRKVVRVNPDLCELCGECAKICPANAIRINGSVKINREICIACLCCHEACPKGAIGL
jgi:NAD-dependent dihydropyrimidine dehydrogenase PreA subunit